MTIDELQKAQVEKTEELFPKLKRGSKSSVQAYGGRFNLDELESVSATAPSIFISFLGIKSAKEQEDERVRLNGLYTAFIVTTDARGLDRDTAGKNMAEIMAKWLPNNRFGLLDVSVPENIAAQNLYSGKARGKGVALWAVSWSQAVTGDKSVFDSDAAVPSTLYIGGELQEDL